MVRKEINRHGTIRYYNEQNQLHREDGPAIECSSGFKAYYIMSKGYSYEQWLAIKDFPLLW